MKTALVPTLSVTVSFAVHVPAWLGVPETTPPLVMPIPLGRLPDAVQDVYAIACG